MALDVNLREQYYAIPIHKYDLKYIYIYIKTVFSIVPNAWNKQKTKKQNKTKFSDCWSIYGTSL